MTKEERAAVLEEAAQRCEAYARAALASPEPIKYAVPPLPDNDTSRAAEGCAKWIRELK